MATFTVITGNYRSRNKFLSLFLLLWSVITFAVTVHYAKNSTELGLEAASSFFIMLGSFMTLILLSMDEFDKYAKYCTIFILAVGSLLWIATGGYLTDHLGHGSSDFGCYVFGEMILIPSLLSLIIAADLYNQFLDDIRIRVVCYSFTLILSSILACVFYFRQDQDKLTDEHKCTEAGFLLILIGASLIFLVIGVMQKVDIAMVNAFTAFIMYLGNFLLLVNPLIKDSNVVVRLVLTFSVIFLVTSDAQAGGTIKVRVRN